MEVSHGHLLAHLRDSRVPGGIWAGDIQGMVGWPGPWHGLGLIFRRKNVQVFISDEPGGWAASRGVDSCAPKCFWLVWRNG